MSPRLTTHLQSVLRSGQKELPSYLAKIFRPLPNWCLNVAQSPSPLFPFNFLLMQVSIVSRCLALASTHRRLRFRLRLQSSWQAPAPFGVALSQLLSKSSALLAMAALADINTKSLPNCLGQFLLLCLVAISHSPMLPLPLNLQPA